MINTLCMDYHRLLMHRVATGYLENLQEMRLHIHHHQKIRYFRSRSLLLVDFMPVKNATNFCFCTTENAEENF
ncbi:hypothetical protein ACSBR2_029103 [Camellia fascicularis]